MTKESYWSGLSDFLSDARLSGGFRRLYQAEALRALEFSSAVEPRSPRVDSTWTDGEVVGEEISYSVGYGPRTVAWLFKPARPAGGTLPAVVALHSHDSYKFHGKEKIADGPGGLPPELSYLRQQVYGGRAYANELARLGYVVLVPDVLMWGSRRFPAEELPSSISPPPENEWMIQEAEYGGPLQVSWYNRLAARHEHAIAKLCISAGVSLSALIAYEDRVALSYLLSRVDVDRARVACIGLSGGGCRAVLLNATSPHIRAAVVVGMMTTYRHLSQQNVASHTWLLFPPELTSSGYDWPDLAGCRAPSPLLVQYLLDDQLFTPEGMEAGHGKISRYYQEAGATKSYTAQFFPGPHRFDLEMQDAAFAFLESKLAL
ncbi:hypothetical protein LDL08_26150 [Nonomuraea glycinis]|nr:hypothetical protein [Nonomuraea glycinis]MCA2179669.1 hypothetical protein [Nonomuraea glycinis]